MARNLIVSCETTHLSKDEMALFAELQPWGFILFARNIEDPTQVIELLAQMKKATGRDDIMVFIDQEGGRVSRLPSTHWRVPPSPTVFAQLYYQNSEIGKRACLLNAILTGLELKALGINANCAPMLDLPQKDTANIIVERSLGYSPQQVIELGRQIANGLKRAGVSPVIKHMPGHGRATSDSHLELPQVSANFAELLEWDFMPFKALSDEPMAMTAHILFEHIDRDKPVTTSSKAIQSIIRNTLKFNGLIMSDDINMQALSGSIAQRAKLCLDAGCDIALHCSGDFSEMKSLLNVSEELSGESLARAQVAEEISFKPMPDLSPSFIHEELHILMAEYA